MHRPNGHLSCFNPLAIASNIVMSMEAQISFWVSAFNSFGIYLEVGFLGHTVILVLRFWEITIVPFYVIEFYREIQPRGYMYITYIFSIFLSIYLSSMGNSSVRRSQPPWGWRLTRPKISSQQAGEPWELMFQLTLKAGKTHCLRSQAVR